MPKSQEERPDTQVTPEPALEKRTRRQLTPEYKLRTIAQADACRQDELGALLRREKIYSSQLSDWRREFAENGVAGLSKSAPGPTIELTGISLNNSRAQTHERQTISHAPHLRYY